ncbi:M20/M25/M40 family metallo-hydrolase [Clostridium sp. AM58-1XD]|uniref:M20/M25/M40 family metallo-hydrolase n=1 Tax=Clostridium sp. AM58-1XD TaxID=2292307 RepID=UPI0015F35370|nr:M20/M25/M40 family metallo-hydrolase [Clostridium sp. AM58-1XD]
MTREEEILEILKELTEVRSISDTDQERLAEEYIKDRLENQEYFHKVLQYRNQWMGNMLPPAGSYSIPGDYLKRGAVYGLVKGKGRKTLILTGHYDVVGVEEYGNLKDYAFSVDQLLEKISLCGKDGGFDDEVLMDAASGEWIFGRGTADMKGGLAVGIALLNEYGKRMQKEQLEGNLLFMAVPDEESYSAGMRGAVSLLNSLKDQYDLDYQCLIDLEPNFMSKGAQEVFVGSAGKCMPAVFVQGAKAHVGSCFQGLSAAGIIGEIFARTELSPEFAESFDGEVCMPPTWLQIRDRKEEYDVSVPYRAGGYFNMLSFSMTPEEVMEKLEAVSREAVSSYQNKMEQMWKRLMKKAEDSAADDSTAFNTGSEKEGCHGAFVRAEVMKYGDLLEVCRLKGKDAFEKFNTELYQMAADRIRTGEWNYPQATIEMMKAVLDYSGIASPLVLLGFAPPYYPAFHSSMLGKENAGDRWFEVLERAGEKRFGRRMRRKHYFTGISDLSYCGISRKGIDGSICGQSKTEQDKGEMEFYGLHAPLWGKLYQIDFDSIKELNIPSLLFGPLSKDIHQRTERVNRESLVKEIPEIIMEMIEQMFAK